MKSMDAAPCGRNQQVDCAVAVHVADAGGVEAERISWNAARVGLQQLSVLARVEIRAAGRYRGAGVLPGSDDQIVATVAVHIARRRRPDADSFPRSAGGTRE